MTTLSRRRFAGALATLPAAAALVGPVLARPPAGVATPPSLAQVRVGRFTVTMISDGFIDLPYGVFTGIDDGDLEAGARARFIHRPTGVRSGFTTWLVDDGERLVLVDTGAAGVISPTSGRLVPALASLGVAPDDIEAVVITHMHVDHISGLVAGERRVFSNASVFIDRRDVAHFTDPAARAQAPDILASSFAQAEKVEALYPDLERTDAPRELAPGISTVDLTGHTPGHQGVRIADAGESLLLVGDMLFHPALHPAHADIGIAFEADAAAAQAMRERFFPAAAAEGALIAATHMPFPGVGRIVRDDGTLTWLAADWSYAD